MSTRRPFRFAGSSPSTSTGREFGEAARRIEALGYDALLVADHFERGWFAVGPALVAAATATTTLRSLVYGNNFRHPALLAREAATIDVLSNGRLELGIGAGYQAPEYAQTGISLPPPGERVERLRETLITNHRHSAAAELAAELGDGNYRASPRIALLPPRQPGRHLGRCPAAARGAWHQVPHRLPHRRGGNRPVDAQLAGT